MPNRILKDSICTSPNIDQLSRDAEVFFYRLLVQCDDYGRMDARPAILRAKCYPLQVDTVTQDDVKRWLDELVRANLVIPYHVNGGDYLQMRTWERHQQIRAKRSKYPDMITDDINCNQLLADAPVIQSNPNPIQSKEAAVAVPTAPVTRNDTVTDAQPIPLAERFHTLLAELKETKNKPAKLREIYVLCFGDSDAPEFSRLGQVATKVGGAGRLAELFWQYSAKPPTGDVLAYIQKAHTQKETNGTNGTDNGYVSPRTKMKDLTYG